MPWRAIVEADVLDRLADDERSSYEEAGEAEDATPRLPGILTQVTNLIRGAIGQNPGNYLGDAGTMPEGSIYHAATLCRASLIASQPTEEGQTTPRTREEAAAWKYIEGIQKKDITFSAPVASPVAASGGEWGGKDLVDF